MELWRCPLNTKKNQEKTWFSMIVKIESDETVVFTYVLSQSISIYHVDTNVTVEKITIDRNPWKRSRPMQSIYDFFVRKYT